MSKIAYAYMRASTNPKLQKNSIDIQSSVISAFAEQHGYEVKETYVEYKSGADDSREGATLITWKIDRMSRSLSIFERIQHSLHLLRFCELGNNPPDLLTLSVLLGVAHQERLNTSTRVKACYKALKSNDPNHPWGNPRMAQDVQPLGEAVRVANAVQFNERINNICNDFRAAGYCTLKELAVKLNQVGLTTRRGCEFSATNLQRILNYGPINA